MKKNLLLISLDTLRADVGYSGRIPLLNSFRKKGITFLNTFSSSPFTPASHATIFTGLQPYNHGIRHLFRESLDSKIPTFTEKLKEEGYQTAAVVSCPGMNKWYGFHKGFDYYNDEIPRLPDGSDPLETVDVKKRGAALKRAHLVAEMGEKVLCEFSKEKPFFLFLHFFDAHWPYEAPEDFGGDNAYEGEVAYAAHHLEKFIEMAEKNGFLENTTVVVFSDHGEDLDGLYPNDKGGEENGHPEELGHGCLLYDQTVKVVLMILDQDLSHGKDIKKQVRLVDVAPTILDLLKVDSAGFTFDGTSLLPIVNGDDLDLPAYAETFYPEEQNKATNNMYPASLNKKAIIVQNKYKTIMNLGGTIEVYDLEQDPNETVNIYKGN